MCLRPDICRQERRYAEAPVTLVQFSVVLLSVVFRALKPFTLGRSTVNTVTHNQGITAH